MVIIENDKTKENTIMRLAAIPQYSNVVSPTNRITFPQKCKKNTFDNVVVSSNDQQKAAVKQQKNTDTSRVLPTVDRCIWVNHVICQNTERLDDIFKNDASIVHKRQCTAVWKTQQNCRNGSLNLCIYDRKATSIKAS